MSTRRFAYCFSGNLSASDLSFYCTKVCRRIIKIRNIAYNTYKYVIIRIICITRIDTYFTYFRTRTAVNSDIVHGCVDSGLRLVLAGNARSHSWSSRILSVFYSDQVLLLVLKSDILAVHI